MLAPCLLDFRHPRLRCCSELQCPPGGQKDLEPVLEASMHSSMHGPDMTRWSQRLVENPRVTGAGAKGLGKGIHTHLETRQGRGKGMQHTHLET